MEQAEKAYAQLLSNEQEMRLLRDAPASVHTRAEIVIACAHAKSARDHLEMIRLLEADDVES